MTDQPDFIIDRARSLALNAGKHPCCAGAAHVWVCRAQRWARKRGLEPLLNELDLCERFIANTRIRQI